MSVADKATKTRIVKNLKTANAALASIRPQAGARWWNYSVSHRTFNMVVGEPTGKRNVVLALVGCEHVTGPVDWLRARLRVKCQWTPERPHEVCKYILEDRSVGFCAVGEFLTWKQDFDVHRHHTLPYPRKGGVLTHPGMKLESIRKLINGKLREFYDGRVDYDLLQGQIHALLWYGLPPVKAGGPDARANVHEL